MKRLQDPSKKKKPSITAQVYLKIPFSVSSSMTNSDEFSIACKNDYSNKSQIFKKILYQMMDVKNDNEFQKKMIKAVKFSRKEVYKIINISDGEFSKKVLEEINSYISKNKGA